MRLLETADLMSVIAVCPPVSHLSGNRSPEVHAPWKGDGRIGVSCREGMLRERSDEGGNIVSRLGHQLCFLLAASQEADR